jgi:penicillin-binding protein 1A
MDIHFQRLSHNVGLATYFREFIRQTISAKEPARKDYSKWNYKKYQEDSARWLNDPLYGWCNKNLKPNGRTLRPLYRWPENLYYHRFQNAKIC